MRLNPLHLSPKHAAFGVCLQFVLAWMYPYRRSRDLGNARDLKDGGIELENEYSKAFAMRKGL